MCSSLILPTVVCAGVYGQFLGDPRSQGVGRWNGGEGSYVFLREVVGEAAKLLTKTSRKLVVKVIVWRRVRAALLSSILFTKPCEGRSVAVWRRLSMMLHTVLVAAQKYGGDLHHTIWRQSGTTMSMPPMLVM